MLDVGVNIGISTRVLAVRFPAAMAGVVERHAENFELLVRNTEGLGEVTDWIGRVESALEAYSMRWTERELLNAACEVAAILPALNRRDVLDENTSENIAPGSKILV